MGKSPPISLTIMSIALGVKATLTAAHIEMMKIVRLLKGQALFVQTIPSQQQQQPQVQLLQHEEQPQPQHQQQVSFEKH